jgi:hypothetical protein
VSTVISSRIQREPLDQHRRRCKHVLRYILYIKPLIRPDSHNVCVCVRVFVLSLNTKTASTCRHPIYSFRPNSSASSDTSFDPPGTRKRKETHIEKEKKKHRGDWGMYIFRVRGRDHNMRGRGGENKNLSNIITSSWTTRYRIRKHHAAKNQKEKNTTSQPDLHKFFRSQDLDLSII